jgi:hypothetical protein
MDANQQLEDKNYKLRTQLEVLLSNETSDQENENYEMLQDLKKVRGDLNETLLYLFTKMENYE